MPREIEELVVFFQRFPGIGRQSAERIVTTLLERGKQEISKLVSMLNAILDNIVQCSVCGNIDLQDPCTICADPFRDASVICVVPAFRDIYRIERTGAFKGKYHVLGGLIDPLAESYPEQLNIEALYERVSAGEVKELFFALPPTPEGEITLNYIVDHLPRKDLKISVLARGISAGSSLEYVDPVTLQKAIQYRTTIKGSE